MDGDFEAFVLARRRSLLRTAWLLTGDWERAEDLVQSALLRCYPHWGRIAAGDPDAYVRRALARLATSWWRRRWRGEVPTEVLPERADRDPYAQVDLRLAVLGALAQLPARQRAAVVLRYLDDLSEAQTAAALDCSVGTVKSQTAAALARLRAAGLQPLLTGQEARDGRPATDRA